MLANYDAKAVAEAMGLAFLRDGGDEASAGRRPAAAGDFVILVDGVPLHLVEIRADSSLAPFTRRQAAGGRAVDFERRRVSSPSPVLIEKAVENGLPRQSLRHLAEQLAGGDRAKVSALEWGVVPKTTLERRDTLLSPQESERTERVARLFVHARRALGTDAEARDFMAAPHPELDGRSPIDAARTDLGTRRAERLLNALEYGLSL